MKPIRTSFFNFYKNRSIFIKINRFLSISPIFMKTGRFLWKPFDFRPISMGLTYHIEHGCSCTFKFKKRGQVERERETFQNSYSATWSWKKVQTARVDDMCSPGYVSIILPSYWPAAGLSRSRFYLKKGQVKRGKKILVPITKQKCWGIIMLIGVTRPSLHGFPQQQSYLFPSIRSSEHSIYHFALNCPQQKWHVFQHSNSLYSFLFTSTNLK
jgi:uncharacterized membrane protein